jgi:hypothetical protein
MKRPAASPVRSSVCGLLLGLTVLGWGREVCAQGAAAGPPCTLRGVSQLPTNTPIYASDGKAIARFSGSDSPLSAGAPDARGWAVVETGTGSGSFRIKGQIEANKIPVFTAQSLPVVAGHVWIGAHRRVTLIGAAPGRLKVQKVLSFPLAQTVSAWGPCSAFSLTAGTPPGWSYAGDARGYILKQGTLDLFDNAGPNNLLVHTLFKAPEADGVLFYSTEQRGGWVHVEHQGEIMVNAWAKLPELKALPAGETMDQLAQPTTTRNPARIAVQGEPRTVRTWREVPLRAAAKDNDAIIGVIETGTDTYVLDVMAGWASVMPKSLNVMPVENGGFWVKASDLGV